MFRARRNDSEGLLYHATLSGKDNSIVRSLSSGIDAKRSKGYGQGAGFYLFDEKKRAIAHVQGLLEGKFDKQVPVEGEPIIVVVDEPVTPVNFDIDYEVYGQKFIEFMLDNKDFFNSVKDQLEGMHTSQITSFGVSSPKRIRYELKTIGGRDVVVLHADTSRTSLTPESTEISAERGAHIALIAANLSQSYPEKFLEFERLYLPKATALKYTGPKIQPLRIEKLDGTVIWQRGASKENGFTRYNPRKNYLFSYGSNNLEQLYERLGHPVSGKSAYVEGMGRAFRGNSRRWGGGVATLIPLRSTTTFGYVAEVSADDLDILDRYEGVPTSYRREQVQVMMEKNGSFVPVVATVYLSNSTVKTPPSRAYLEAIAKLLNEFWQEDGRKITVNDITIR